METGIPLIIIHGVTSPSSDSVEKEGENNKILTRNLKGFSEEEIFKLNLEG